MRVLVTGANGHVGNNLVRELLSREHEVVPFVRESSNLEGLEPLGLTPVFGDVRDADSVLRAAEGCDAIENLAAVYAYGGTVEEIVEPAVQGIENVLRAAAEHGIERVVHTSSIVAVGVSDTEAVLDESHWNQAPGDPYMRAKTDSERRAWELADELSVPMIALNPAAIVGRHDYKGTPSNGFVREHVHSPGSYHGGLNYVDVRDVARVHAQALTHGEPGERYIVAGDNLSARDMVALVTECTGKWAMHYHQPRWMMKPTASLIEGGSKLLGIEPMTTRPVVDEFYRRWCWYDNAKARAAFDWTPIPPRELIDDTLQWLVHRDRLKPRIAARLRDTLGDPPDYR
jgi:dihydroflavonol-4-reductase